MQNEYPVDPEMRVRASQADWMFQYSIVSVAGNSVLTETYEFLRSRQQRASIETGMRFPNLIRKYDEHHTAMIDAWREVDQGEFRRILSEHLHPSERILASLDEDLPACPWAEP